MNPWRKKLVRDWLELAVEWFCHSLRAIHRGAFGVADDDTMRAWASADAALRVAGHAFGIIDAKRPAPMFKELPVPTRAHCPVAELTELDAQSFDETDESVLARINANPDGLLLRTK